MAELHLNESAEAVGIVRASIRPKIIKHTTNGRGISKIIGPPGGVDWNRKLINKVGNHKINDIVMRGKEPH